MLFRVGIWLNYIAPKQGGGTGANRVNTYFAKDTILSVVHLSSNCILSANSEICMTISFYYYLQVELRNVEEIYFIQNDFVNQLPEDLIYRAVTWHETKGLCFGKALRYFIGWAENTTFAFCMIQHIFKAHLSCKKICLWVFYINITHIKWFFKLKMNYWIW